MFLRCFIAVSIVITYSSCCKVECVDSQQMGSVYFNNFNPGELDTLLFTSFVRDSNFSTPVDSFYVYTYTATSPESQQIFLDYSIDIRNDWRINVVSTQTVYELTQMATKRVECGHCLGGHTYFSRLDSYKVNGNALHNDVITIYR